MNDDDVKDDDDDDGMMKMMMMTLISSKTTKTQRAVITITFPNKIILQQYQCHNIMLRDDSHLKFGFFSSSVIFQCILTFSSH